MRSLFVFCLLFCLLTACRPPAAVVDNTSIATRPNVIFILTDDQGWGDLGLHGNDSISTPHLDALGRSSVRFDRFYVSPVCAPTRASFLTGRYHPRTGTQGVTRGLETMATEEVTLGEVFQRVGYRTGYFGKWHNGEHYPHDPLGQGFERFFGFSAGHWNNYFDTDLIDQRALVPTRGFITDVLTEQAMKYIEQHRNEPFLCYLAYNAPHTPNQVPDRYFDKYKARGLSDYNAGIYGMVENIDDNVGRLLHSLDSLGLADNTIVIFSTDNGPNGSRYTGGMKGQKGQVDEGGVRVPFFLRWPAGQLAHGRTVAPIAAHIDLLPTLADLCRIPLPTGRQIDGRSLAPLLRQPTLAWPERTLYTFSHQTAPATTPAAVRRWPYLWVLAHDSTAALYNLEQDPGQNLNIIAHTPVMARQLANSYARILAEVSRSRVLPFAIPLGYADAPKVRLPGPEARVKGRTAYSQGSGWANDWLVGWEGAGDTATWPIRVQQPATYLVSVGYTFSAGYEGSALAVGNGQETLLLLPPEPYDPPHRPSPDRTPRKEVYEKAWRYAELGPIRLDTTDSFLHLFVPPGKTGLGIAVKEVVLQQLD